MVDSLYYAIITGMIVASTVESGARQDSSRVTRVHDPRQARPSATATSTR